MGHPSLRITPRPTMLKMEFSIRKETIDHSDGIVLSSPP
jgi:hypothetical protein